MNTETKLLNYHQGLLTTLHQAKQHFSKLSTACNTYQCGACSLRHYNSSFLLSAAHVMLLTGLRSLVKAEEDCHHINKERLWQRILTLKMFNVTCHYYVPKAGQTAELNVIHVKCYLHRRQTAFYHRQSKLPLQKQIVCML